jgi:CBS domain-containing protein
MKVTDLLKGAPEVLTVEEDDDLALARQMMAWAGVRHLPVLRAGQVVGVLSEGDILRYQVAEGSPKNLRHRVGAAMSQPVEVVHPDTDLSEVSERMLKWQVGCLPVVEAGRLVGIVTRSDLIAIQARESRGLPALGSRLPVAGVMTRAPRTARPGENLLDAIVRMAEVGVRHLPVVNEQHELVGMLSDRDIRDALGDPRYVQQGGGSTADEAAMVTVEQVMSAPALAVQEDEDLLSVTGDLIDQRVGAFAVVDQAGRLVGMLSYIDVLTVLYRESRARSGERSEVGIGDSLGG